MSLLCTKPLCLFPLMCLKCALIYSFLCSVTIPIIGLEHGFGGMFLAMDAHIWLHQKQSTEERATCACVRGGVCERACVQVWTASKHCSLSASVSIPTYTALVAPELDTPQIPSLSPVDIAFRLEISSSCLSSLYLSCLGKQASSPQSQEELAYSPPRIVVWVG